MSVGPQACRSKTQRLNMIQFTGELQFMIMMCLAKRCRYSRWKRCLSLQCEHNSHHCVSTSPAKNKLSLMK